MGKKILIGVLTILVLVVVFVLGPLRRHIPSALHSITGPACAQGPLFSTSLIAPGDILSITPLGNIGPPDHTIPTDHMYIVLKNGNDIVPSNAKPVHMPAEAVLSSITQATTKMNGALFTNDFAISFSPCKDVQIRLDHVNFLSDELLAAFEKNKERCETHNPRPTDEYTYCQAALNLSVKAGAVLGTAGSQRASGLDVQTIDRRQPPLAYANPKRYGGDQFYFACTLDLFEPTLRQTFYDKLGNGNTKRTIEPRCGAVNQDIAGTAQGNWITGVGSSDSMEEPENWGKSMALVHDNFDPSVGIASIGGLIGNSTKIVFVPKHDGTINREFSEVKPDGMVYCYQTDSQAGSGNVARSGSLLIQLTNATTLQAELKQSACSIINSFSKSTIYER